MKKRIVMIGAGSREFSRGMIHDLVNAKELLESFDVEVVMVDVNEKRLAVMADYAKRCRDVMGVRMGIESTTDRERALPGADFVMVSIAINRMELWEQDFRVPLSFGFKHIYGENGGPGALFHALRNFKILMPICRDIERLAPGALVLNFTNPEARVLKLILTLTGLKAVGLCHGFHSFRRFAVSVLNRPEETLDIRTAGINHFFTCYRLTDADTGEDLRPELDGRIAGNPAVLEPLARHLWETFGILGYPSDHHIGEYVGYAHEFVGSGWLFGVEEREILPVEDRVDSRTTFDAWRYRMDIRRYLDEVPDREENELLSGTRRLERKHITESGELAIPIISDILLDRKEWRAAVNVLNTERYIENLPEDGCIEVPATVDASGVHPERIGNLPEPLAAMIRTQQSIQRLLVEAFDTGSRRLLLQALLLDPTTPGAGAASAMLGRMLELQKGYLPAFS